MRKYDDEMGTTSGGYGGNDEVMAISFFLRRGFFGDTAASLFRLKSRLHREYATMVK